MCAWLEGERQQHKWEHERLRLEMREKPFPHEASSAVGTGLREVGLSPALGGVGGGWGFQAWTG